MGSSIIVRFNIQFFKKIASTFLVMSMIQIGLGNELMETLWKGEKIKFLGISGSVREIAHMNQIGIMIL